SSSSMAIVQSSLDVEASASRVVVVATATPPLVTRCLVRARRPSRVVGDCLSGLRLAASATAVGRDLWAPFSRRTRTKSATGDSSDGRAERELLHGIEGGVGQGLVAASG